MSDTISEQARADFQQARFQAFMNRIWATLSGQPTTLLSYDEIKEKLHIGGPIYRGVKTVRVDQIAGSLNRYHEFVRIFLPTSDKLADRWTSVNPFAIGDGDTDLYGYVASQHDPRGRLWYVRAAYKF